MLSEPVEREEMHARRVECRGFLRADGLWDIEGRITDTKTYAADNRWRGRLEPGTPIHDMLVRMTVNDELVVQSIEAVTTAAPYPVCPAATEPMQGLVGLRIAPGWTQAVKRVLGGPRGCTHLMELMGPLATVAYQTIAPKRKPRELAPAEPGRKPGKIDSCWAYSADRDVVRELWPEYYTGPRDGAA